MFTFSFSFRFYHQSSSHLFFFFNFSTKTFQDLFSLFPDVRQDAMSIEQVRRINFFFLNRNYTSRSGSHDKCEKTDLILLITYMTLFCINENDILSTVQNFKTLSFRQIILFFYSSFIITKIWSP